MPNPDLRPLITYLSRNGDPGTTAFHFLDNTPAAHAARAYMRHLGTTQVPTEESISGLTTAQRASEERRLSHVINQNPRERRRNIAALQSFDPNQSTAAGRASQTIDTGPSHFQVDRTTAAETDFRSLSQQAHGAAPAASQATSPMANAVTPDSAEAAAAPPPATTVTETNTPASSDNTTAPTAAPNNTDGSAQGQITAPPPAASDNIDGSQANVNSGAAQGAAQEQGQAQIPAAPVVAVAPVAPHNGTVPVDQAQIDAATNAANVRNATAHAAEVAAAEHRRVLESNARNGIVDSSLQSPMAPAPATTPATETQPNQLTAPAPTVAPAAAQPVDNINSNQGQGAVTGEVTPLTDSQRAAFSDTYNKLSTEAQRLPESDPRRLQLSQALQTVADLTSNNAPASQINEVFQSVQNTVHEPQGVNFQGNISPDKLNPQVPVTVDSITASIQQILSQPTAGRNAGPDAGLSRRDKRNVRRLLAQLKHSSRRGGSPIQEQLNTINGELNQYIRTDLRKEIATTTQNQINERRQAEQLQSISNQTLASSDPNAGRSFPETANSTSAFLDPGLEANVHNLQSQIESTTNEIAQIQSRLVDEAAGIQGQAAADARDISAQANVRRSQLQQEQATASHDLMSLLQQSIGTSVDPNRLYGEGKTTQRVIAAAAIALGRIGANFVGQANNEALGIVNAAIQRDIQTQVINMRQTHANIQEQKGLVASLVAQGHGLDQSVAAARAAMFEDASKRVALLGGRLTDNGQTQRARLLSLSLHQKALKEGLPVAVKVLELDSKRRSARELGTHLASAGGVLPGQAVGNGGTGGSLSVKQAQKRIRENTKSLQSEHNGQRIQVAQALINIRNFIGSHPGILASQKLSILLRNIGAGGLADIGQNLASFFGTGTTSDEQEFSELLKKASEALGRAQSGAAISQSEAGTFTQIIVGLANANPNSVMRAQTQWVVGVMQPTIGGLMNESSGDRNVLRGIQASVGVSVYNLIRTTLVNSGIPVIDINTPATPETSATSESPGHRPPRNPPPPPPPAPDPPSIRDDGLNPEDL